MTTVTLTVDGLREVQDAFLQSPRRTVRGVKRALDKTARFAASRLAAEISRETRIPRRVFMERRRIQVLPVRGQTRSIFLGHNPITARRVKPLGQHDWGASAGQYLFQGSFLAPIPDAGRPGIFRRTGSFSRPARGHFVGLKREKIAPETIALPQAPAVADRVAAQAAERLRRLVPQELNYALRIEGFRE